MWRKNVGFDAEAPKSPSKKLQHFLVRVVSASTFSGSVVSARPNDQASKTILLAVLGPIIFPFKWWKSCLSIRGDKVLLIKDPLKGKEWGWGERMKEQERIMERDCS